MPEVVGENIDRAITLEMRFAQGLPRGVTTPLYTAAREAQGGGSLSMLAARRLQQAVKPGSAVMIVSGAGQYPWLPFGESDGPPGAASIARAVSLGLGARPVFVSEQPNLGPMAATARAAGLLSGDRRLWESRPGAVLSVAFPLGSEVDGKAVARELLDDLKPAAIIYIEKIGPNEKGVSHSIMGTRIQTEFSANVHELAHLARERGILTIGIGDGGNEIGCGKIRDAVRKVQPYGEKCQCGCGGGNATVVETDVLVFAAVSNWGAYGVSAALSYLVRKPEIFQSERVERLMIEQCALAGGTDGAYSTPELFVDGIPEETNGAIVRILGTVVRNGLLTFKRPF